MTRPGLCSGLAVVLVALGVLAGPAVWAQPPSGDPFGPPATLPPSVPEGFQVQPVAAFPTPTALAFSPDGDTLYVSSLTGSVVAYPVLPAGLGLGPPVPFVSGLEMPLGVLATRHGVFISVVDNGTGAVMRAQDTSGDGTADTVETVITGLPIGRHNTNGLGLGPDGMLYILNGNSTDSGFRSEGGPPEQPPFSGSLLRVNPLATDLTPEPSMVVATGWRNIFDLAFVPENHPVLRHGLVAIPQNGPDGQEYEQPDGTTKQRPAGEDTLSLVDIGNGVIEHFGFPWCLYDRDRGGLDGFTQDPEEGSCRPLPADASKGLDRSVVRAKPVALFGLHVSANGLDFNPGTDFPAEFDGDLFVAQFGNNFGEEVTGHKVVRVQFGQGGGQGTGLNAHVESVENFMTGAAPLGLAFGPDGAMWVADFGGHILRVSALSAPDPLMLE